MSDTTVAGSTLGPAESKNGPPVHLPPAVERTVTARIPTAGGAFYLHHFRSAGDGKNHLALVLGEAEGDDLLVRIHSECFTGDVLGSQRCDCGEQLTRAMQAIAAEGRGALIYLRQEGRGIGLEEKLRAYNLQDEGYDTVDANLLLGHQADERDYTAAALILQELGVRSVRMLTNNPAKIEGLAGLGIAVRERIPLQMPSNPESHAYLEAKVARMRHIIRLNGRGGTEKKKENEEKKGEREHLAYGQAEAYRPQLDGLRARIQSHNCGEAEENSNKNAFLLTPRPFVTLSYAQSLDGCLTTQQGMATPISAPASLTMTHTLRATHRAILVGIETVLADDPALTVRLIAGDNPQPVIVDSHLRTPPGARLLQSCGAPWIATTPEGARSSRRQRLEEAGARILTLPADQEGRVDLAALLACLGTEGIGSLMVEGGARILTSFLEGGLADYAVITIAPIFLGGYQMIQPAGAGDELRATMPRLQNVEQVQLATDTVLWGEFEKRVARNGRSAA
ncbi:MAG: GTP cyclohydrolase II [Caldilineaceae bacterium]|nr:GTP cyclohydrolase II [Caldilineaceae bacterium]